MAATFRPVNSPLPAEQRKDTIATPTMTPRPSTAPSQTPRPAQDAVFSAGALASQKPLPNDRFPDSVAIPESTPPTAGQKREREHSQQPSRAKSDDVAMNESEGEPGAAGARGGTSGAAGSTGTQGSNDEGHGSGDESNDGNKSKKKKSQRFYCTDYPPCNLSFTRSEHLARHIRKHTGERPFQCHCSRRFSRLDNLRQHAQTVHLNEDIPIDSLAATGTRYQRQIRTDRIGRTTGRVRSTTTSSIGPVRGHAKSLSTSNIANLSSITGSAFTLGDNGRRPPPLVVNDPMARPSFEHYASGEGPQYRAPSPGDFSTPTSATFSTAQNSPRWNPIVAPSGGHGGHGHVRSQSMYVDSKTTPARRLSVPSGGNPFQSPGGPSARPVFGPSAIGSSGSESASPAQGSILSPPAGSAPTWQRRESVSTVADDTWRRRTWHPDSRDFNPSRLSQVMVPSQIAPETISDHPPPLSQPIRLPGIESFDNIRPPTPPRRALSPMRVDTELAIRPGPGPRPDPILDRRPTVQWDSSLDRGINRLDLNTPPRDSAGAWAHETNQALMMRNEPVRDPPKPQTYTTPYPPHPQYTTASGPPQYTTSGPPQYTAAPAPEPVREPPRHVSWYDGPPAAPPPPPQPREPTYDTRPRMDRMLHPNLSNFQGFPAREQPPPVRQHTVPVMEPNPYTAERPPNQSGNTSESMKRLQALVAVATSEGTAY